MITPPYPPIRNLHSTIILISITILNPPYFLLPPLQITHPPTHSLTPPSSYSINHQHPNYTEPC